MPAHILVATDDPCACVLLEYNLIKCGYSVTHANRGDEIDARIAKREPDLVLLEWRLPGVSGLEACRRLRASYPRQRLPIVLLLESPRPADVEHALRLGASRVLAKPISLRELTSCVGELLQCVPVEKRLADAQ